MEQKKFEVLLMLLVRQIVFLIMRTYKYDEETATKELYASKVYANLSKEETKLWRLSALTLFCMFEEEKATGIFTVLDESWF